MTRPHRRLPRAVSALLAAGLLLALCWHPVGVAAAAVSLGPHSVRVTVLQVTPSAPAPSTHKQRLTVQLQLTNTTRANFRQLTIEGVRGNPINNQSALDAAIAKPAAPDPSLAGEFSTHRPVTTALGPGATTTVSYVSTTGKYGADAGLCLCENRIYPLYLTVHFIPPHAADVVVGSAQTFIPSFGASLPHPTQVSWVWPLLERPHRTTSYDLFTDDTLAASVSGGRLDHLLQTIEQVVSAAPTLAMTLLVDPDLIDELAVMAAGKYYVQTTGGHRIAGAGTEAAAQWLSRFAAVLAEDPDLQLAFTPYADPDVRSLADNNLRWTQRLDDKAQARVAAALGRGVADTDVSWPADGALSTRTLDALLRSGVHTVIVDSATVPGSTRQSPTPNALAPASTAAGHGVLAITSAVVERYVDTVVSAGGAGMSKLPELVAEVAVRAVEVGDRSHYLVITPPRDVDPDPATAAAAVLATANAYWSESLSLRQAVQTVTPVRQGRVRSSSQRSGLPAQTIAAARYVTQNLPAVTSLLKRPAGAPDDETGAATQTAEAAAKLIAGLPLAVQRSESAEWARAPSGSASLAGSLQQRVDQVLGGVHLIRPTKGTYTLGSSDSPLPITIDNTLDLTVYVRIRVDTVGGLPGFSAGDVGVQAVGPHSRLPVHIPAHVVRAGRIRVQVGLTTTTDQPLGVPLELSVRSTALGDIGKIITFGAGAVLAAALLFRLLRRWRRHRGAGVRASSEDSVGTPVGAP